MERRSARGGGGAMAGVGKRVIEFDDTLHTATSQHTYFTIDTVHHNSHNGGARKRGRAKIKPQDTRSPQINACMRRNQFPTLALLVTAHAAAVVVVSAFHPAAPRRFPAAATTSALPPRPTLPSGAPGREHPHPVGHHPRRHHHHHHRHHRRRARIILRAGYKSPDEANSYNDDAFGLVFLTGGILSRDADFAFTFVFLSVIAALAAKIGFEMAKDMRAPAAIAFATLLLSPIVSSLRKSGSLDDISPPMPVEIGVCLLSAIWAFVNNKNHHERR
jgi:hypothetical protein